MSLGTALLLLTSFWCILHLVHRLLSHRFPSSSHSSLLPTTTNGSNTNPIFRFGSSSHPLSHPKPYSHPKSHYNTTLTLTPFHFRLSTTRWNAPHDRLTSFLSLRSNRSRRLRTFVKGAYDLGVALGALGMLAACLGLVWACWGAWGRFGRSERLVEDGLEGVGGAGGGGAGLTKRSLDDPLNPPTTLTPNAGAGSSTSWAQITPIIPGVTVPLSHLPLILLAVFLAQAFHELGHALAAALESLPLLSTGASLTLFLPSAFVSFPSPTSSSSVSTLPAPSRARLIAAGPFHNILLWAFLLLLARSGLLPLLCGVLSGYRDVAGVGRVVVRVAETSPLYLHLPPGSIITALDDTPLGQPPSGHVEDEWTRYLLSTPHILPSLGWCVARHVLAKSDECCKTPNLHPNPPSNRTASPYACFTSLSPLPSPSASPSELIQGCIDPVPILTSPHSNSKTNNRNRCSSTTDCPPESACVAPRASAELMRFSVRPPGVVWEMPLPLSGSGLVKDGGVDVGKGEGVRVDVGKEDVRKEEEGGREDADEEGREWGRENVVLWSGPREEVWEEVQVTTWLPRASFLPLWVPLLVQLFWDYLLTATLSLYFFNLLPLPHLDGTQLLCALLDIALDMKTRPFMYDLESLESGVGHGSRDRDEYEGTRNRKRWKERVVRFANYGTGGVVGCFVVLSVMNGFG